MGDGLLSYNSFNSKKCARASYRRDYFFSSSNAYKLRVLFNYLVAL